MSDPESQPTESPVPRGREYWCFVSYRHADNHEQDRGWASWLHQEIERYEVPADLVGQVNSRGDTIPERIYPVFRDEESLPADADLGKSIASALDRSRFMVVICSPRAVRSYYVGEEILHYKRRGHGDRIIAAMIDGEPNTSWDEGKQEAGFDPASECFPEALRHPVTASGELDRGSRNEPVAADFRLPDGTEGYTSAEAYALALDREGRGSQRQVKEMAAAYGEQLQLMKLKIIAGILGLGLEQLRDRDRIYQLQLAERKARVLRRWLAALAVLVLVAVGAALLAMQQRNLAVANSREAEHRQGKLWMKLARQPVEQDTVWLETPLYAAKAIGFEGLGRPQRIAGVGEDERAYWDKTHPILLDRERDERAYQEALALLNATQGIRAVWRTDVVNHHEDSVQAVAYSPDGRWLASVGRPGWLKIWDVRSGALLHRIEAHPDHIHALAFSPDGKWIATGARDAEVRIWDAQDGVELMALRGHTDRVSSVVFHPSSPILASGSSDGSVRLWDLTDGSTRWELTAGDGLQVTCVDFGPDGKSVVCGTLGFGPDVKRVCVLWEVATGKEIQRIPLPYAMGASAIAFHPDGRRFATGEYHQFRSDLPLPDIRITLWDAVSGEELGAFTGHHHEVSSLAFDRDGSRLLSSSKDGSVYLWDVAGRSIAKRLKGEEAFTHSAAWSADEATVAAATESGRIWFWDAATGERKGAPSRGRSVTFSPDGSLLAIGTMDGGIQLWNTSDGVLVQQIEAHESRVADLAFSPDGGSLASVSGGSLKIPSRIKLWEVEPFREVAVLWEHIYSMSRLAFSDDGRFLTTGTGNGLLKVWDTGTREEIIDLATNDGGAAVSCVAFSPDHQLLAVGGYDFSIRLFDLPGGNEVAMIDRAHLDRYIQDLSFSPDGTLLASAGGEPGRPDAVRIWDVAKFKAGEAKEVVEKGSIAEEAAQGLAFDPNKETKHLAVGSHDGMVRLWDLDFTGPGGNKIFKRIGTFAAHGGAVRSLAFSPEGRWLATGNDIRLWDLRPDSPTGIVLAHETLVTDLGFNLEGNRLVTASASLLGSKTLAREGEPPGESKVWEFPGLAPIRTSEPQRFGIAGAALAPGNTVISLPIWGGKLHTWNYETGEEATPKVRQSAGQAGAMVASRDGRLVAVASSFPGLVTVWDREAESEVMRVQVNDNRVLALEFHPDGDRIAVGTGDHLVLVLDLKGKTVARLAGHRSAVEALAFSSDGKLLASGSASTDGTIRIWDLAAGAELRVLPGHKQFESISSLAFHPSGKVLASGAMPVLDPKGKRTEIKLWEVRSGRVVRNMQPPFQRVLCLAYSPDGSHLVAGGDDGRIGVWNSEREPIDWATYLEDGWFVLEEESVSLEWVDTVDNLYRTVPFERLVPGWEGAGSGQ